MIYTKNYEDKLEIFDSDDEEQVAKAYVPRIFGFKLYGKQGSKFHGAKAQPRRGAVQQKPVPEEMPLPILRESSSNVGPGGEGKKKKKNKKQKHESSVTSPVKK